MDQQRFLELLQEIQIPNTQRIKAATSELRKYYYPHPDSLLCLLHILTNHNAPEMRQQAAVESLRLVSKHWASLGAEQRLTIREKLLQSILEEQKKSVQHSSARVIAAVARIESKNGKWSQLPGLLIQISTSDQALRREIGIFTIFSLLEFTVDVFDGKINDLFQLFNTTIKDPESAEVRINTLLCLSKIAIMIEPDEDQTTVSNFNNIFPQMVAVLKAAIDEDDENHAMQAFEVFHTLLGCDSDLLNKHFRDLLCFMIDISANTDISDDSRCQALSFIMQSVKYRKMKIQGLRDMGEMITLRALQIVTEIDYDVLDDYDDVISSSLALELLYSIATNLPPRQVIVPLLKVLPQYVQNENPKYRQAGILAVGMCVEGAPDFISSQIDVLIPSILQLLNDSDVHVRMASLKSVAKLADELVEDLSKYHEKIISLILKNLDSAMNTQTFSEVESPIILETMKSSCRALDSVCRGISKSIMQKFISELVPRLGNLLAHPNLSVKSSAAGALGSISESAKDAFLPYYETSMKALSAFLSIKDSTEDLELRGVVCDTIGSIATAVGSEAFKPYVNHLMQASEEGLLLDHSRLRETSYILWSIFAKLYEAEFSPFLKGVTKSLFECLNQEESDLNVELGEGVQDLLGEDVVVSGKKVQSSSKDTNCTQIDGNRDDDDSDWEDDFANNAVAMEKEVAIEVLGDVMSYTRRNFMPYFEEAVKITLALVEHGYDGLRKAAIGTLWRSYACLWTLYIDESSQQWTPGLPLKQQLSGELLKLGELVTTATIGIWEDETNRAVVIDINRNIDATLKLCGPAVLSHKNFTERLLSTCMTIITKSHPCQQDLGDSAENIEFANEESSEYDWLAIETALDVVTALSKALGSQFGEIWKMFQKPIMKYASSQVNYERSTAVGVIAECTANMGDAVSPYTKTILTLLLHRLSDEDAETKSNAAFAIGQLIFHSTASEEYLDSFPTIFSKLEPLLEFPETRSRDNAAGCICRMIMGHLDRVPLQELLAILIDILPLKEDYEENTPIYDCIIGLYNQAHPIILSYITKLLPIFASVLGEPYDQLELPTRIKIITTVKSIAEREPNLSGSNEKLVRVLQNSVNGVLTPKNDNESQANELG